MPLAMLVAPPGDVRDAVGLFLAGLGWTTVPVPQAVEGLPERVAAVEPRLVAVDFRGDPDAALACAAALGGVAPDAAVFLLNVPEALRARIAAVAGAARVATAPGDLPRAPGVPGPPH
ncbi:MAG: hypothetical protein IT200_12430 [Thermoleophilia bacterium]|nr:hypothetical protein [Thermoleophilia bacterium]